MLLKKIPEIFPVLQEEGFSGIPGGRFRNLPFYKGKAILEFFKKLNGYDRRFQCVSRPSIRRLRITAWKWRSKLWERGLPDGPIKATSS